MVGDPDINDTMDDPELVEAYEERLKSEGKPVPETPEQEEAQ